MFCVYVLQCGDGNFYIGQTSDLKKRLERHRKNPSRQMKVRLPIDLIGHIQVTSRSEAVRLEAELKKLKKRDLVLKRINGGLSSAG